jgi:hypothetical protein
MKKFIDNPIQFSFRQEKENNETLCTAKEFCGICIVDYPLQVNWIIFWFLMSICFSPEWRVIVIYTSLLGGLRMGMNLCVNRSLLMQLKLVGFLGCQLRMLIHDIWFLIFLVSCV